MHLIKIDWLNLTIVTITIVIVKLQCFKTKKTHYYQDQNLDLNFSQITAIKDSLFIFIYKNLF